MMVSLLKSVCLCALCSSVIIKICRFDTMWLEPPISCWSLTFLVCSPFAPCIQSVQKTCRSSFDGTLEAGQTVTIVCSVDQALQQVLYQVRVVVSCGQVQHITFTRPRCRLQWVKMVWFYPHLTPPFLQE